MKSTVNPILSVISQITQAPACTPKEVKALMRRLHLNEKAFALVMNVTPMTVRLWTTGAAKPCNLSRRLMQIYSHCPDVIDCISIEPPPAGQ